MKQKLLGQSLGRLPQIVGKISNVLDTSEFYLKSVGIGPSKLGIRFLRLRNLSKGIPLRPYLKRSNVVNVARCLGIRSFHV